MLLLSAYGPTARRTHPHVFLRDRVPRDTAEAALAQMALRAGEDGAARPSPQVRCLSDVAFLITRVQVAAHGSSLLGSCLPLSAAVLS